MGVRIMERARDRFITAVLVTLIPCAARTTVIFALVAFYLGPLKALLLYILNVVVIAVAGKILSRYMPDVSPGMILEMPSYKSPQFSAVLRKVWFRLREFVLIAWPILIAGSVILSSWNISISLRVSTGSSLFSPAGCWPSFGSGHHPHFRHFEKGASDYHACPGSWDNQLFLRHDRGTNDGFTVFSLFYIPCLQRWHVALHHREPGHALYPVFQHCHRHADGPRHTGSLLGLLRKTL